MSVSIEQLVALNDEIASLVQGGVPLDLGLRELGRDSTGSLQQITQSLAARMQSGASLTEALAGERQHLPPTYRTMVEAGIRTGRLAVALEAVSNYARELIELRRQITLALIYPLIVVVLAYVLFAVFVADLLERFRETYELFRFPMPWFLGTLSQLAEWVTHWWWAFPLFLLLLVVWWTGTGGAKILAFSGVAQPLAWIPFVGGITRQFRHANFSELLAMMVEHGVPLPEGLRLAAEATGDSWMRWAGENLAGAIERGDPLVAGEYRLYGFPPFLFWALSRGQRGEALARLLRHAATIYRRRSLNMSRWFKTLFPVTAAVVIGGGVTAIYGLALFGPLAKFWSDLGVD